MTIEVLYRVQCPECERYLGEEVVSAPPVQPNSSDSPLFITFDSAYQEAVRRGWNAIPLLCPDCTPRRT